MKEEKNLAPDGTLVDFSDIPYFGDTDLSNTVSAKNRLFRMFQKNEKGKENKLVADNKNGE